MVKIKVDNHWKMRNCFWHIIRTWNNDSPCQKKNTHLWTDVILLHFALLRIKSVISFPHPPTHQSSKKIYFEIAETQLNISLSLSLDLYCNISCDYVAISCRLPRFWIPRVKGCFCYICCLQYFYIILTKRVAVYEFRQWFPWKELLKCLLKESLEFCLNLWFMLF